MIKKLCSCLKEFKKYAIITPSFMVLEVVMEIFIPFLLSSLIDNGISKGDLGYIYKVGALMLVAACFSLTFGILGGKSGATASTGFARNLRKEMYYNIQNFSFSNIDKYSTAGLVTRLTTDVTNVQNAFQMVIRMFVRAPFTMICAMVMSFYINFKISLIFLGAIIVLGIALYFIMTKAHPYFRELFRNYDKLNASVQENLTGIRVVKAYVREEHEKDKFKKASKRLYDLSLMAEKLIILNNPIMQFVMYSCIILISWLGANMIVQNTMQTGELVSLFTYLMNILMSLMMVSFVFVMVIMSKSSAERIVEVLEEKSNIVNPENPVLDVKDGSIEFENACFKYSDEEEDLDLDKINININSGETVGILGGTGSSKTTLVQLIPRLYDVTRGSIKVGGVDVRNYDIETLRDSVSMVLQKNVLFSGTIKENLRWGNKNATDEEIIRACKASCADEFIEKMPEKYDTFIEQGGNNVSGGQKQRLCIARALLKKPKILILDDSTSAVDTRTDALIRKSFKEDIPSTTKIIIAQRISSIQECDKIIVLDDGKINAVGTHDELVKSNPIYKDVYMSQVKGDDKDA